MTVYEMAKKYYPKLWGKERLASLVGANKLSAEEYASLTGEPVEPALETETEEVE